MLEILTSRGLIWSLRTLRCTLHMLLDILESELKIKKITENCDENVVSEINKKNLVCPIIREGLGTLLWIFVFS